MHKSAAHSLVIVVNILQVTDPQDGQVRHHLLAPGSGCHCCPGSEQRHCSCQACHRTRCYCKASKRNRPCCGCASQGHHCPCCHHHHHHQASDHHHTCHKGRTRQNHRGCSNHHHRSAGWRHYNHCSNPRNCCCCSSQVWSHYGCRLGCCCRCDGCCNAAAAVSS